MIFFTKIDIKGDKVADTISAASNIKHLKQREFASANGKLILLSDDQDLLKSSRLFSKIGNLALQIFDELHKYFRTQLEVQSHTLKGIQAHLAQKIEQIIDSPLQGKSLSYAEKRELLKKKILEDPDKATDVLLYLDKRIFDLDAHMSSFQILHMGEFIDLQVQKHNIIRLILNIWHAFDDEFKGKNIRYQFNFSDAYANEKQIRLDYKTINAAFHNFFSNAVKYAKPNSAINFSFETSNDEFVLKISMTSLIIEQNELERIFELGYRSIHCKDKIGTGVGMFVVKKAFDLNNLSIRVETDSKSISEDKSYSYSLNTFIISGKQ